MSYKKLFCGLCILGILKIGNVSASMADYKNDFKINLETEKLPTLQELKDSIDSEDQYYEKKYHTVWDLTGEFDRVFYERASTYGINEKRLKWPEEEQVLQFLESIPKEKYPYYGPMLFLIPNMSEKVLNIPEIKATKNQFPKVIAEQLKDVKDIEFLSPFLYYILMPEVWPENFKKIEYPKFKPYHPKVEYNAKFYQALQKLVPPEDFYPDAKKKKVSKSDLRTLRPTMSTLLTGADVRAVANSLDRVQNWYESDKNVLDIGKVSLLLWQKETAEKPEIVAGLKELVNPCARLVQKAKIGGKELELARQVASEGFTLNEWAYTCDKTIKAYRLSTLDISQMQTLRNYKLGLGEEEIKKLPPDMQKSRYATMQAIVEASNAPLSDMVEVQKNRKLLDEKFKKFNYKLFGNPIRIDN